MSLSVWVCRDLTWYLLLRIGSCYLYWYLGIARLFSSSLCDKEKATKAWHRHGMQENNRTKSGHIQLKRPSADTTRRSCTELHRKIVPRVKSHTTHKRNHPTRMLHAPGQLYTDPAAPTSAFSQGTQPSARRRRAVPHYYAGTTRNSSDTWQPPPVWPPS